MRPPAGPSQPVPSTSTSTSTKDRQNGGCCTHVACNKTKDHHFICFSGSSELFHVCQVLLVICLFHWCCCYCYLFLKKQTKKKHLMTLLEGKELTTTIARFWKHLIPRVCPCRINEPFNEPTYRNTTPYWSLFCYSARPRAGEERSTALTSACLLSPCDKVCSLVKHKRDNLQHAARIRQDERPRVNISDSSSCQSCASAFSSARFPTALGFELRRCTGTACALSHSKQGEQRMPWSESEPEGERGGGCKKAGIDNIVVAVNSVHLGNGACTRLTQAASKKYRGNFVILSESE